MKDKLIKLESKLRPLWTIGLMFVVLIFLIGFTTEVVVSRGTVEVVGKGTVDRVAGFFGSTVVEQHIVYIRFIEEYKFNCFSGETKKRVIETYEIVPLFIMKACKVGDFYRYSEGILKLNKGNLIEKGKQYEPK